jgi:hypothetical protein
MIYVSIKKKEKARIWEQNTVVRTASNTLPPDIVRMWHITKICSNSEDSEK